MNEFIPEANCQVEDVAAYLDGELGGQALERFEVHLKSCVDCAAELRAQRQLLCTLDAAFGESNSFRLPHDFTRVVTARAESDLMGVRDKSERRRALQLCAILTLLSVALLGAAVRALVLDPVRSFLRITASFANFAWQAIYQATSGAAVVVRVIGRAILFAPYGVGFFLAVAFLCSISLLPFLIVKYHRAQIIE